MSAAPKVKDFIRFEIEVTHGPHIGLALSFSKDAVTIGRDSDNDITLASDSRVSRNHAEIKFQGDEFVLINLSLKNFVLLDGENIQSGKLKRGSLIQIGGSEIRFTPSEAIDSNEKTALIGLESSSSKAVVFKESLPQKATPIKTPFFVNESIKRLESVTPLNPLKNPLPSFSSELGHGMDQFAAPKASHTQSLRPQVKGPIARESLNENKKMRFYLIIAVVAFFGWLLLSSSKKKNARDPNAIRNSSVVMQNVAEADKRSQEILSLKKDKYDSVQYRRAQENFIRGFRDFQQGQYDRAREAFQVVLNLDPENELAKRYYQLSNIKFDELVKFNLIQGNRYREKRNWRMCQSNYSNVMTMLQGRKDDPTFKEARQLYQECSLNVETGRF
jgi:pSer/pThr/pTyr-binding forkhead associated (FHA) protein